MKRPKVLVLNSSAGIGSRSTSKMAAQSYSRGINQQMCSKLFDILIGCLDIDI